MAQKVTVSPEINLRSDRAYYLLGQVDESILLFRDQGDKKILDIFEENLVLSSERNVDLLSDRALVYDVINTDSAFSVFYGFNDEDEVVVQMDVFNATANRIDSVEISREERSFKALQYEPIISENKNIIALYNITDRDQMTLLVFDIERKKTLLNSKYKLVDLNLYEDIMQIEVSNQGDVIILYERNNTKSAKENHFARLIRFLSNGEETEEINLPLKDVITSDLFFKIDNKNRRLAITGLYDEKSRDQSIGYVWINGSINRWQDEQVYLIPFEEVVFFEVYGNNKVKKLRNFQVSSLLLKADGSPILVFEHSRNVLRQNGGVTGFNNTNTFRGQRGGFNSAGWSDHYREDLVIISLDRKLELDWYHVFYKKQFSQNDDALFSSYFTFMTPSRVRLIYNDEIKTSSTVSEYIFDGAGNYKRNSLLSTEYQNLRLIFQYAIQISNSSLIVPSQRNSALSLVKVDYSQ
jgi:hypothetical protein